MKFLTDFMTKNLPNFSIAKNLACNEITQGKPWEFIIPDEDNWPKRLPKDERRQEMLKPNTDWQVYSAVVGIASNLRVSNTNPPRWLNGLVVDYDSKMTPEEADHYLQQMPASYRPAYIETTLSGKIRLVWLFERPMLVASSEFCRALIERFFKVLGVPILLAGYDAHSVEPTEVWTNGGKWSTVDPDRQDEPTHFLSPEYCFGVACEVGKKTSLFDNGEIPLETIAEEVQKRLPGRWQGDFKLDALGVRFWDEKADNPTGCQVKPDGMLCFTGNEPFMKWEAIFGRQWCEEQKVLNLGRAAEGIYFDGRSYWEQNAGRWESICRADAQLRLKARGLSDRTRKGTSVSEVERALNHLQLANRVQGVAPLINYAPGLVEFQGRRILNTADLRPVQPVAGPTGVPQKDFPWTWNFLDGLFARPELRPLDHFLAWLQRSYRALLNYKRHAGQAAFICGPKNNGKTLLGLRVIKPLLGNRSGNPIDYMTGETSFNDDLYENALLIIDDENAPESEGKRQRMLAKLKGLVVNPCHRFNAKFDKRVMIDWVGRIVVLLNNDPGSVGMLAEVSPNTRDKQLLFATQPYQGQFPPQDELEAIIAKELPYFAHWLLHLYQPPVQVLASDRMGVQPYLDPTILELANQQTFCRNLLELLREWMRVAAHWVDNQNWEGTGTALLTSLQTCIETAGIAKTWNQQRVAKALTALAKQEGSGVSFVDEAGTNFRIVNPTQESGGTMPTTGGG